MSKVRILVGPKPPNHINTNIYVNGKPLHTVKSYKLRCAVEEPTTLKLEFHKISKDKCVLTKTIEKYCEYDDDIKICWVNNWRERLIALR